MEGIFPHLQERENLGFPGVAAAPRAGRILSRSGTSLTPAVPGEPLCDLQLPRGQESSPSQGSQLHGGKETASPAPVEAQSLAGSSDQGLLFLPCSASDFIPQVSKETMRVAVASTASCPLVSPPSQPLPGIVLLPCLPGGAGMSCTCWWLAGLCSGMEQGKVTLSLSVLLPPSAPAGPVPAFPSHTKPLV